MGYEALILNFKYHPALIGMGLEDPSKVMLLAYVTKDLGHSSDVRRPGLEEHKFCLQIKTPEATGTSKPFIEADAGVVIRAFAASINDDGQKVMRQVGGAFFNIRQLVSNSTTIRRVGTDYLSVPNLYNPSTKTMPQKGTIEIFVEPNPALANCVLPQTKYDYVPENVQAYNEVLTQYQQTVRMPYSELQPTYPNATGLCMPIVTCGIAKLPGALFAYPRSQPSSPEWHYNAFLAATRRAYPHLESKEQTEAFLSADKLTETEIMNILMLSHTAVVANGTCYVGDGAFVCEGNDLAIAGREQSAMITGFDKLMQSNVSSAKLLANKRDIAGTCKVGMIQQKINEICADMQTKIQFVSMEDFMVGLCRSMKDVENWGCLGAIDCEDGGMDAMIQAMDFRYADFSRYPIMKRVQEVQRNYEPTQSLEYVNGQQLADGEHTNNRLGGHLKSAYVTRTYEQQMEETGSTARPVFDRSVPVRAAAPKDYLTTPVIDGEGTGLMMPVPNDAQADQMERNHRYLEIFTEQNASSMRGTRFMMPHHKTKASRFYNTINSWVPLPLADEGFPAIEHIATKTTARGTTIGIDYREFINGHSTNSAFVAGRMTEEQVPYMQHLLKFLPPVPAYEAVPDPVDASHPLLDRLVASVKEQRRPENSRAATEYYQVYIRQHDVRESTINTLMEQARAKHRVFKVSYHHENFGKSLCSWCVQFHLNPA